MTQKSNDIHALPIDLMHACSPCCPIKMKISSFLCNSNTETTSAPRDEPTPPAPKPPPAPFAIILKTKKFQNI